MKKYLLLTRLLFVFSLSLMAVSCDDDDDSGASGTDFGTIASSYHEADGTGTVTIPLRNVGSTSGLSVDFAGSATEGEDFELSGITNEGVTINVIDDATLEGNETIRVQLLRNGKSTSGNAFHTITIVSNCEDQGGLALEDFAGDFSAIEKYGAEPAAWYGPYHLTLVQDEEDPTIFWMDNFYDSGRDAYIKVDLATGTAYFPDQTPLPDSSPNPLTESEGVFDFCTHNGHLTLTITLDYDGGAWEYEFVKE